MYTCRAIIDLQWHVAGGIMMHRTPEEPSNNIMLHIHTNQWQAMKGIVQRNQTDCAFHDPIQSHFAFNNENHLFSLWSYSNNYEKWQQGTIGKITLAKKFTIQNILCQSHLGLFEKKYFNRHAFCHIQGFHKAGLKKVFVGRHSTLGLRVGQSIRIFLYFGEGQSHSQCLTIFDISFVEEKRIYLDYCYYR